MKYSLDTDSLNYIVEEFDYYSPIIKDLKKLVAKMVKTSLDKQSGNYADAIQTSYGQYEKDLKMIMLKIDNLANIIDEYAKELNKYYKPYMGIIKVKLDEVIKECESLRMFFEKSNERYAAYDVQEVVKEANLIIDKIDEDLKIKDEEKNSMNKEMLMLKKRTLLNNMAVYQECISEINTLNFNSEISGIEKVLQDLYNIVDVEEEFAMQFSELDNTELISDYSISQQNNFKKNSLNLEVIHTEADMIREKNWHEFVEQITVVLGTIALGIAVVGFFWAGMPALITAIGLIAENVALATTATTIGYHLKNKEYGELVMDSLAIGVSATSLALPKIDEAIKGTDEALDRLDEIKVMEDELLTDAGESIFDFSTLTEALDDYADVLEWKKFCLNIELPKIDASTSKTILEWSKKALENTKQGIYFAKDLELGVSYTVTEYNLNKEAIEGIRNGEPWPRVIFERLWGEAYNDLNVLKKGNVLEK